MQEEKARTLRVAAVQVESQNGMIEANLKHALSFVEEAAKKGAKLIVLPEFLPTGYIFTKAIWDAGEPKEGPTVKWLKENSKRLAIHLGTSFLEADGEDFFNTFVITTPEGKEAGRVRKQTPASFEAYFTKGDVGPHIIVTEFGKIGVGICYENQLAYMPRLMNRESPDIYLMPHSAPTPAKSVFFPAMAVKLWNEMLKNLTHWYSTALGTPSVMINKCGEWHTTLPGLPFLTQHSSFPGLSAISDSDGKLKAQLGGEEGVIVEDVLLDPTKKTNIVPPCYGRWAIKSHWAINSFRLIEFIGSSWYSMSSDRKAIARKISSGV